MSEDILQFDKGKAIAFFQQHLTPLYFTFQKDGHKSNGLITAFPLEVHGHWFLITAGHVLKEIEDFVKSGGEVVKCRLIDTLASDAPDKKLSLPFDYEAEVTAHFDYNKGLDFGVLPIRSIQREAMERNHVTPFNEEMWQEPEGRADYYMLLGAPSELAELDDYVAKFGSLIYQVLPLDEKPEAFPEVEGSMFYGVLRESDVVSSIKGMSGGPILALRWVDGHLRYWLHAIQSAWLPNTREIRACQVWAFAEILSDVVRETENKFGGEG
jgi:hypothetical protein